MPIPSSSALERRRPLRDQFADTLRDAILDGTLQPGERLRDEELIAWLGGSRSPVREALSTLVAEGLVEMLPNRYTRVVVPSAERFVGALRTIGTVMRGVVEATVPLFTSEQRSATVARIDLALESIRPGPGQEAAAARMMYGIGANYDAWLDACPNQVLADVGRRSITGLAYDLRVDPISAFLPIERLDEGLRRLRAAVDAGDGGAAGRAVEYVHLLPPGPRG